MNYKNGLKFTKFFVHRFVALIALIGLILPIAAPVDAWTVPSWIKPRIALADDSQLLPVFVVPDVQAQVEAKGSMVRDARAGKIYTADITAYTSSVDECDSDPFITADGSVTRDGIVAANFLPFGTKIRIPSAFGDRIFEVHDRMNARYFYRVDIWMKTKPDAKQFGLKRQAPIEIVEWGNGKTQWGKKNVTEVDNG